jgi:hypothetical protein
MHYKVLDFVNQALDHTNREFKLDGIRVIAWSEDGAIRRICLQSPPDNPHNDELRELAYELVTTLLSETTNNDACEVVVREKSAHHENLPFGAIVIDATVEDELT